MPFSVPIESGPKYREGRPGRYFSEPLERASGESLGHPFLLIKKKKEYSLYSFTPPDTPTLDSRKRFCMEQAEGYLCEPVKKSLEGPVP
jgi:hypothetical protein